MSEYFSKIKFRDETYNNMNIVEVIRKTDLYKNLMKKYNDNVLYEKLPGIRREIIGQRKFEGLRFERSKKELAKRLNKDYGVDEDLRKLVGEFLFERARFDRIRKSFVHEDLKRRGHSDKEILGFFVEYSKILQQTDRTKNLDESTNHVMECVQTLSEVSRYFVLKIHNYLKENFPVLEFGENVIPFVDVIESMVMIY